ncbi:hypothetical protein ACWEKM_05645 [Streptomyces sp. NPDC004752]
MRHQISAGPVPLPWEVAPRFDSELRSPLIDGWTWRTLPPRHPALLGNPPTLRRNDPGDALSVIAEKYGEPTSYCVLGGNVASVGNWAGVTFDEQYEAVTHGAGVFPCGGMYYLTITGPHAAHVLNLLTPRRIDVLEVGQATFAIFTTPEGTVDTECVVLRDGEESFTVSVGGDTRPPTWLHDAIDAYPDTHAEEAELSSFNIKGAGRLRDMSLLLSDEFANRLDKLGTFRGMRVRTRWGADAWVVRTVIGIELWGTPEVMNTAWRDMMSDPGRYTPCGWDILATFRLECPEFAFYLCPLDIHRGTYLRDAGLGYLVTKRKQSAFIGSEALWNPDRFGGRMWVGGLMAKSSTAPRRSIGERFVSDTVETSEGYVTSSGYSPRAGRELCFAGLPTTVAPDTDVRFRDGTTWRVLPLPMLSRPAEERLP